MYTIIVFIIWSYPGVCIVCGCNIVGMKSATSWWAWLVWINTEMVYSQMVIHPNTLWVNFVDVTISATTMPNEPL